MMMMMTMMMNSRVKRPGDIKCTRDATPEERRGVATTTVTAGEASDEDSRTQSVSSPGESHESSRG